MSTTVRHRGVLSAKVRGNLTFPRIQKIRNNNLALAVNADGGNVGFSGRRATGVVYFLAVPATMDTFCLHLITKLARPLVGTAGHATVFTTASRRKL